ncbi:MAG: putative peptidoglycan lipid flippase [Actinomycetota bacterium]|nr:putative peptidoglycan lipid flippase [Actinomycetota bacterium]
MGTLLSRVTGLLRVAVLAYAVGRASLADTYNLANSTPNIVYELLLGGVLSATLVPLFVDHLERGDRHATSAVFTVALSVLVVLTAIAMLFAPLIARLYSLDTSGSERTAQLHVMTVLTLWFLPQMVFYGLTALASAMLNARRRFVAAAYAPVLNNLIVIGVLAAFAHMTAGSRSEWIDVRRISGDAGKLTLLGAGTTAGIAAMGLVLLPAMHHARTRLRAAFDWKHPAVRKMLRLSGWTVAYVVTNQIALLFVLVLAKSGTTGDVSAYLYAYAFYQVPHGLLAVSIMTTMMPELSRSAAQLDLAGLARKFRLGLRYVVLLMLPAAVLFVALAQPMVGVLVRGGFRPHDAAVTADTLQAFSIGLVPFSVYLYALRGFYALADTRTPFVINAIENVANVGLALALFPSLGVQGLALAWTGAYSVAAILALVMLRRRVPDPFDASVGASVVRASIAGIALAIVASPLAAAIGRATANRALVASAAATLAGGIAYLLVLLALRAPELRSLFASLRRTAAPLDV